ncbi:hypothetical protein K488DRAFT_74448 [Vararia minispora EC-137]|uniref:Uncharacterized protein n=1 Tax=Vararia minispora EC-137 TaxID=1314806 RepID=A0ACB8Q770_9AGAM|nr:hypothetical protein K488DRAFT_74448 [Vararia minispora EC-137]
MPSDPKTTPPPPSPQLQTVLTWYHALASWDLDTVSSLMRDDYTHVTLPATADDGVKDKEEGLAYARGIANLFGGFPVKHEIYDVVESGDKIWVHSKLLGSLPSGVTFNNESLFLFTLAESRRGGRPQIKGVKEFVDTKMLDSFRRSIGVANNGST